MSLQHCYIQTGILQSYRQGCASSHRFKSKILDDNGILLTRKSTFPGYLRFPIVLLYRNGKFKRIVMKIICVNDTCMWSHLFEVLRSWLWVCSCYNRKKETERKKNTQYKNSFSFPNTIHQTLNIRWKYEITKHKLPQQIWTELYVVNNIWTFSTINARESSSRKRSDRWSIN